MKKRLSVSLLALILLLLSLCTPVAAASGTGHQISVNIYQVTLDSSKPLGYQTPTLIDTITVTCTDSTGHSGYNHSVPLKRFHPSALGLTTTDWTGYSFATYFNPNAVQGTFYDWTSSSVNATANVTGSEPYPCSKNFYLVYKGAEPDPGPGPGGDEDETFTITYTDGVNGTAFSDQVYTAKSGDPTPAFTGTPSRDGYRFNGWLPAVSDTVTANATYVAQWEKLGGEEPEPGGDEDETFTITYTDGVNGTAFADQVYTVKSGDPTPAFTGTPSRDGYRFNGWLPAVSETVTANATYVAQWEKLGGEEPEPGGDEDETFTITYTDGVNGTAFADQVYTIKSGDPTPAFTGTPSRDGYRFNGWLPAVSDTVTANATYVAQWEKLGGEEPEPGPGPGPGPGPKPGGDDDHDHNHGTSGILPGFSADAHLAYLYGYPDGTIRPEGNITRAEAVTVFYRLLSDSRREELLTSYNDFMDVSRSDWYNKAVSSMAAGGYVQGYLDGNFHGNLPITRAEFVSIAARFAVCPRGTDTFSDVPATHWASRAICAAASYGWVTGYTDGTFCPDQPITRAEAAAIVNRMLSRGVSKGYICKGAVRFPDNRTTDWYYYEILEATNDHEYRNARPFEQWLSTDVPHSYDLVRYERP